MNLRYVIAHLGLVLLVLCAALGAIMLWDAVAWMSGSADHLGMLAMGITLAIGGAAGSLMWLIGRQRGEHAHGLEQLGRREALLLVALTWLVGAAVAGLPFYFWAHLRAGVSDTAGSHVFLSFSACYFEAMSGFTTTGATVLHDIPVLPKSLLLWRATTHWLGGLGIVVLFVAVLPVLGMGGKKLYQVEAPGPSKTGVRPRIAETARVLWGTYLLLTLLQIVALWLCGMTGFDAVCHTFATLATGGFSTENASIGHYNSWAIDAITTVFMIFAGLNFGLYYQLAQRRFRTVWKDPELRAYLGIIALATGVIALYLVGSKVVTTTGDSFIAGPASAFRYALFNVVSIQTTTGFGTADFNLWPFLPKAILVMLMFVGGCAGSTGGGIKVIRVVVAVKVAFAEIEKVFRPRVVRTIRIGEGLVDHHMKLSVVSYALGIIVLFALGSVGIMVLQPAGSVSFITAATAAAATLNNIGPGLQAVGPVENYGNFTAPALWLMSLLMALGRLEIFALLALLSPRFWKRD